MHIQRDLIFADRERRSHFRISRSSHRRMYAWCSHFFFSFFFYRRRVADRRNDARCISFLVGCLTCLLHEDEPG
ncbi:hypothetical protein PUN28_001949 [Cardiocondyla obscurior]|uniref:Uncharacterized protein n=1 Tax=Cardiocondyla obscurior TaxID=286306 RepID=A0AAW2GRT8_9HYME